MAIDRVSKVLIAVHKEKKDDFLTRLQQVGLLHITETGWQTLESKEPVLQHLINIIELLTAQGHADKKIGRKVQVTREEYENIARGYDPSEQLKRIEELVKKKEKLEKRRERITEQRSALQPWQKFPYSPQELETLSRVKVLFGRFPERAEFHTALHQLAEKPATLQMIEEKEGVVFAVTIVLVEAVEEVNSILRGCHWEEVGLPKEKSPAKALADLEKEENKILEELSGVEQEIDRLSAELPRMKVKADFLLNAQKRSVVGEALPKTETVFLIYGWVKDREMKKLDNLVEETGLAAISRIPPEKNETPPVALVNRRLWRPFELVLELYQLPLPQELDPTWLIAPFFGLFFALCLTDAGYGIVLTIITYFLMRKLGMGNKLLGIILIGAILTIPCGALVGGWFGDIFDRLGIPWLASLKGKLMWFDPMKEPLKFFILSLALGYLQLITGIAFEIADCLRVKNFGEGLLGQFPWFLFFNSLMVRLILGKFLPVWANSLLLILILLAVSAIVVFTRRESKTMLAQWLWFGLLFSFLVFLVARWGWLPTVFRQAKWLVLAFFLANTFYAGRTIFALQRGIGFFFRLGLGFATLATIFLYLFKPLPALVPAVLGVLFYFSTPAGQRLVKKFMWGGYALYGATSYLGVILSYIRLMALGMCTGGVAVAINVIAWMLLPVPVLGPILALLILVGGHAYNIAVNVLGAFVHSLRLQYVEFFPRFYTGGGEPFVPFREERQFVVLKS